ncbi:tetratricopeptide (TPR) repeat protein [Crossiella equi]|uniref:Tetratricopeptide (TPR) repeat protein n=1 Tax=Crossiella equi TaxID=130796 RepID=A0ABS5A5W8_9PSEU|nr:tetratricopeptide repeat protein [Crossiella equi]MBP2471642.1 tetratricopeptide (TPR) repeat protein [Crossiella equi]
MTHNQHSGPVHGVLVQAQTIGGVTVSQPAPTPVPHQLPSAPPGFVGRDAELGKITGPVVALAGTGGVGKTALALHWAHRHRAEFPDGQLFADLRGFSPEDSPVPPEAVLRGFLDALGVPTPPPDPAAHFRTLLAERRVLVVLDNAATAAQVQPLLPGAPGCVVLVTSRDHLPGLLAAGAAHVPVGTLSGPESHDLLAARLGHDRLAAEPEATGALLTACGGFPLMLTLVAARAATQPGVPLAEIAADLATLDEDGPALHAVLSWSFRALSTVDQEAFARLGQAPGPDIGLRAACHLLDFPEPGTRAVLRRLERASLLTRQRGDRWRMHDLVRDFAARTHPDPSATTRVVEHYVRTALAANHRLDDLHEAPVPVPDLPFTETSALAWFDAEHDCLTAAVEHADDERAWLLAWTLTTYQQRRGHLQAHLDAWRAGLAAAHRLGEPYRHTTAHRLLGRAHARLGQHDEALVHFQHALAIPQDDTARAHTHRALAHVLSALGNHDTAVTHASYALALLLRSDSEEWAAKALNDLGWYEARAGDFAEASRVCADALDRSRRRGYRDGMVNARHSLGWLAHRAGAHAEAAEHLREAVALAQELGDRYQEATSLSLLADALHALADPAAPAVRAQADALLLAQGRADTT